MFVSERPSGLVWLIYNIVVSERVILLGVATISPRSKVARLML